MEDLHINKYGGEVEKVKFCVKRVRCGEIAHSSEGKKWRESMMMIPVTSFFIFVLCQ